MSVRPAAVTDLATRLGAQVRPADEQVRLVQSGLLRSGPRSRWMRFTARQSIRVGRAGFAWVARTGPLGLLTVRDELEGEEASGSVHLLDCVPLVRAAPSVALAKADLMRYLAELAWAPDAMLSNDRLDWTELAAGRLQVAAHCAGVEAAVTFTLDSGGVISHVEAEDRPRQEGRAMRERPWRGAFSDYRVVDGRLLPHAAEVAWVVDGDVVPVWRGRLDSWAMYPSAGAVRR